MSHPVPTKVFPKLSPEIDGFSDITEMNTSVMKASY